jgi:hypothetical protein
LIKKLSLIGVDDLREVLASSFYVLASVCVKEFKLLVHVALVVVLVTTNNMRVRKSSQVDFKR